MQQSQKIIGVDIGATKTHVGVVQDGKVLSEIRLATSAHAPKEQVLKETAEGIEYLIDSETVGIGIGVPGLVDEKRGIVCGVKNIPSWKEVHLKQYLEDYFNKPVYVTNDANSFVLGEKIYGKGKKFKNIVGITLGSGFGTGIIASNKLYSGTLASAGEFGGIPYLGKTIEDYCSGKLFKNEFGTNGLLVQALAEGGNTSALEMFEQFGYHLGNAIKVVLYALSPEAIFLGGSISKSYPLFEKAMRVSLESYPFRAVIEKLIIEPSEIDKAAILGAAALFQTKNKAKLSYHKV
ncbi:glucokinase [Pontibacter ummariensis]|uniref:Glucokinase n=1 Tax=Pontibacter ummariensis TaxID=1610492 RepID=A0A239LPD5_9BACT|nr:ROK family protein [Pontibacter ummariensis]PRY02918.1 glucokinase [Pontibacter ummariensis]SNT32547.1 glucokinase [Pontibacter ummariensis]